ncbi:MAG: hypothetical protein H0T51_07805 [Pirellulales bacterium]|nr:hypothetical protein [Pirellulales bacterium]
MNASDDFDRIAAIECRNLIPELCSYGEDGQRLPKFAMQSARKHFRNGVHLKHKLKQAVRKDCKEEFGSVILMALIGAVIHFIVVRLLERLYPKSCTTSK